MENGLVRVLHVEDQEIVRIAVERLLDADDRIAVVGHAETVDQAKAALHSLAPSVALIEPLVDHGHGMALIRWIGANLPECTVVVMSAVTHPAFVREVRETGATGFIGKGHVATEIADVIVDTHRRGAFAWEDLTSIERVIPAEDADRLKLLTPRERQVLEAIGEGATNRAIADRHGLTEKTVKNYVSHLLAKLAMRTRSEAAALAGRLDFAEHPELSTSEWHEVLPVGSRLTSIGAERDT